MSNIFSLAKKVIVVTGGYGHLGTSITQGLAEQGAEVVVLGRSLNKFEKKFKGANNIHFQDFDISSTQSIKDGFQNIHKKFHKIDVLINNAFYVSSDANPDKNWEKSIDGTLNSVQRCIREVLPYFRANKGGKIINVSSMYGMVAPDFAIYKNCEQFTNPPHYGAAKAGVIQLTKYYASLLGQENITVNTVSPGPFPSAAVQENQNFIENLNQKTALKRIGQPDDLKGIFVFLSADCSTYITGQNMAVDGGWTIV